MSSAPHLPAQNGQPSPPGQVSQRARVLVHVGLALLAGPVVLLTLKVAPALDLRYQSAIGHFIVVTAAALLAVFLALLMVRAAIARRDGRALLIGSAFLCLSGLFSIHAVSTPNVLFRHTSHATQWSTPVALLACAVLLALSAIDTVARQRWLIEQWRRWLYLLFVGWLLYSATMLFYVPTISAPALENAGVSSRAAGEHAHQPSRYEMGGAYGGDSQAEGLPQPTAPAATSSLSTRLMALGRRVFPYLTAISTLLYTCTALLYGRRWRRTPTRPLLAVTCAAVLLAETTLAAQFSVTWHLSFWLYHVLLLAAVFTVTYGIVIAYEQSGSLSSAVEGLLLGSTLQRQREAFQSGMAALLGALERGDLQAIPEVREALRQRFALADDQLDLLDHAVGLVAQERQEQRRLRALAEVSRAATLDLDPDLLLRNVIATLAQTTAPALCAVGLVQDTRMIFAPQHQWLRGSVAQAPLELPLELLPQSWQAGEPVPVAGPLPPALAALGCDQAAALLVPLWHHQAALGALVIQHDDSAGLDERLIAVYSSIAAHLATAFSNARLYQELRHQHNEMLRAENAKEQLMQMIVHDLKSPLTAVIGYLDLLKATGLRPDQVEIVDGGRQSSSAMARLVDDILDIARLEEGRLELRREPSDIVALLQRCSDELGHWARQEQKEVGLAVGDALPELLIDSSLIRRVIINLFSNAIKHTPPGVRIVLGAGLEGESIRIWVHDSGPGIPAEKQPLLFERFSTAGSGSERQSSTGLGLAFCKLAVEAHGGQIAVESAHERGTVFAILLPLQSVREPAAA